MLVQQYLNWLGYPDTPNGNKISLIDTTIICFIFSNSKHIVCGVSGKIGRKVQNRYCTSTLRKDTYPTTKMYILTTTIN